MLSKVPVAEVDAGFKLLCYRIFTAGTFVVFRLVDHSGIILRSGLNIRSRLTVFRYALPQYRLVWWRPLCCVCVCVCEREPVALLRLVVIFFCPVVFFPPQFKRSLIVSFVFYMLTFGENIALLISTVNASGVSSTLFLLSGDHLIILSMLN